MPQNSAQTDSSFRLCLDAAYRFLSLRPRSELEVRTRLKKKGYSDACIDKVLAELKRQGVLDDYSFARFWTENRESFSPRSRSLIRMELRGKGVDPQIVLEAVEDIDEEESAYRAARKRAKRLLQLDFEDYHRLMGNFLRRRGFSYEISRRMLHRVWNEETAKAGTPATRSKKDNAPPDSSRPLSTGENHKSPRPFSVCPTNSE